MGNTNSIVLNGKRYDAVSGRLIDDIIRQPAAVKVAAKAAEPVKSGGQAIDGIIRGSGSSHSPAVAHKPTAAEVVEATIHKAAKSKHHQHHTVGHKPEHAKTLMRSSVKKPAHSLKAHAQTPVPSKLASTTHHLPATHSAVDIDRLVRAQHTTKSNAISRFGAATHASFTKHVQPLAVQAAPAHSKAHHHASSPFDSAIAAASSHEQVAPHVAKKRTHFNSRAFNIIAASAAMLLIVGFFAYQNAPNLDVRIASSRAGFHATVPGFKPSGFAFSGPVKYNSGIVTIGFHSNSDSRNYSIVESPSNWDSQTLLDSFVASTGQTYQTVENGGRTIYVYGNGNATWVNANVWYRITGNASLSSTQLSNIAASM